mgnify:CR=1 FL=1
MKEIITNLYVGNQEDFETGIFIPSEWSFLLAAKEPWHRQALGYTGRAAAKDDPEYLMAKRDNKLILNLVDAPKSIFFNRDVIDAGLDFIKAQLNEGKKVGVFCNQGESRSASIGLLYLITSGHINTDTLEDAEAEFLKLYPEYNPGTGIRGFVKENFEVYKNGQ